MPVREAAPHRSHRPLADSRVAQDHPADDGRHSRLYASPRAPVQHGDRGIPDDPAVPRAHAAPRRHPRAETNAPAASSGHMPRLGFRRTGGEAASAAVVRLAKTHETIGASPHARAMSETLAYTPIHVLAERLRCGDLKPTA